MFDASDECRFVIWYIGKCRHHQSSGVDCQRKLICAVRSVANGNNTLLPRIDIEQPVLVEPLYIPFPKTLSHYTVQHEEYDYHTNLRTTSGSFLLNVTVINS